MKVHCCVLLFAAVACSNGMQADALIDLSDVEHFISATAWLSAHPSDKLEPQSVEHFLQPLSGVAICGMVDSHTTLAGAAADMTTLFRVPDVSLIAAKELTRPDGDLIGKCVLSEMIVESVEKSPDAFQELTAELSQSLGSAKPSLTHRSQIPRSGQWDAQEWNHNGSVWILASQKTTSRVLLIAISQASEALSEAEQKHQLSNSVSDMEEAGLSAAGTKMAPAEIAEMQKLLSEASQLEQSVKTNREQVKLRAINALKSWVPSSRTLPLDRRASALYTADALLALFGFSPDEQPALTELERIGAQFSHDNLGKTNVYSRNWLGEAIQVAPNSEAGQQAFLALVRLGFDTQACDTADSFETIIKRVPDYLNAHLNSRFAGELNLALADAYRDRIAVANGANGDPLDESKKYRADIAANTQKALHYYQAALAKVAAGSEPETQARTHAWALAAGLQLKPGFSVYAISDSSDPAFQHGERMRGKGISQLIARRTSRFAHDLDG